MLGVGLDHYTDQGEAGSLESKELYACCTVA